MSEYVKFTRSAQQVTRYAQEEALRLKHVHIGVEHLFLGLVKEGSGVAAQTLQGMGINLNEARLVVENIVGSGEKNVYRKPVFATGAQETLELAAVEGYRSGNGYVDTEHILLGLLRKGGITEQILETLGVSPDEVFREVIRMMGGDPDDPSWQEDEQECSMCQGNEQKAAAIEDYGSDLTKLAEEEKLEPVIGREKELERVIQILGRRTKNNPCLVGEAGVGKTAIAEGLARKIVRGDVPVYLRDKRVVQLELSALVAGTKHRGEFEERMHQLLQELQEAGNIIVFFDELHTVIGAGAAEGAMDASNILKPALSRGELQAIGATTLNEFRKHVESDAALERRFQPVFVDEPTEEESLQILKGLRERYQDHHRVEIPDETLEAAIKQSTRFIQDRYLPDKAIDLMDESAALVQIRYYTSPASEVQEELDRIRREKEAAVNSQDYERAAELKERQEQLEMELNEEEEPVEQEERGSVNADTRVTEEDIAKVVSDWTGIPVNKLTEEESTMLLNLEAHLRQKVIGQHEAVKAVSRAVRRGRTGLKKPGRPIGSFVFLGPTGVGKTELARRLAEVLFGDADAMHRLDMSEYMESHSTARLVGAPPGYVGYEEAGQLTERVRRRPYSVILLDEVEKAHPEVFHVLLQVLEDGRLTDSRGRTVDFSNTVIIMTSNLGSDSLQKQPTMGFRVGSENEEYQDMKDKALDELHHTFRPEFINRLDDVVVFQSLSREDLGQIVELMLQELSQRVEEYRLELEVSPSAREYLAREGYDPAYGARPLRRVIQKQVEDGLSEEMIAGNLQPGDKVEVDTQEGEGETFLTFKRKEGAVCS